MSQEPLELIPFLRPLEALILDESVSEITVNVDGRISIKRNGLLVAFCELGRFLAGLAFLGKTTCLALRFAGMTFCGSLLWRAS